MEKTIKLIILQVEESGLEFTILPSKLLPPLPRPLPLEVEGWGGSKNPSESSDSTSESVSLSVRTMSPSPQTMFSSSLSSPSPGMSKIICLTLNSFKNQIDKLFKDYRHETR